MCNIKEVTGFSYGGKLYDTRSAAINAGLAEIASDIQRNHSNAVLPGLRKHRDALLYLLGEEKSGAEPVTSKLVDPSLEPPMPPEAVRDLLAEAMKQRAKKDKPFVQKTIKQADYESLPDLLSRASDQHIKALLARIMDCPVNGQVLDAQQHAGNCMSRVTGYESDCRCGVLVLNQ